MNGHIELIWSNEDGESFRIGKLICRNDKYYFSYNKKEVLKAKEVGFEPMDKFSNIDSEYFREDMFNTFSKWYHDQNTKVDKFSKVTIESLSGLHHEGFRFTSLDFEEDEAEVGS